MTSKMADMYLMNGTKYDQMRLYFFSGVNDVPYIDTDTLSSDLQFLGKQIFGTDYKLSVSSKDEVFTFRRENGSSFTFDFKNRSLTYDNIDDLFSHSYYETSVDTLNATGFDDDNQPAYYEREKRLSSERNGNKYSDVNLGDDNIPMYFQDGKGYLPLQTYSDFLISPFLIFYVYNGQDIFMTQGDLTDKAADLFYSAPTGKKSKELADFTYNEFVAYCDTFYRLKKEKNILSFDNYFTDIGLKEELSSTDPLVTDQALCKLAYSYMGDMHTKYLANSAFTGNKIKIAASDYYSYEYKDFVTRMTDITAKRETVYADEVPSYEEVGDTAFLTFDNFTTNTTDYYTDEPTSSAEDTIGKIIYAQKQITAAGDKIKNVVMDLSCNTGGEADAAVFASAWFLGNTCVTLHSTVTGYEGINVYRADTNLDRKFNDNDTLGTRNLYCLISRTSFSCGNLVPNIFKDSGKVSLIGQTSGGGSCAVEPFSLADGTIFRISGYKHLDKEKNGTFYDIDRGATPDYMVSDLSFLYKNRRADLVDYIDSLH